MEPVFSVIIPCYRHGAYLRRNIKSIEAVENIPVEIIIVDDGSPDIETQNELKILQQEGYHVIIQENAGPGAARNNGIRNARGKYIVPLDADDMIRKEYVEKAYEVLEHDLKVDVVYADFQRFGDSNSIEKFKEYSLQELLLGNSIGVCAIFRKAAWEVTGGYNERMGKGYGWEDWELWISMAEKGFQFRYLNMVGYDYYYQRSSRERLFLRDKRKVNYIISLMEEKHKAFYDPEAIHRNLIHQVQVSPVGMLGKIILAAFFPKYYKRALDKGKIKKYLF